MRRRTLALLSALAFALPAACADTGGGAADADAEGARVAAGPAATDIYLLHLEGAGEALATTGEPVRVTDRDGYDNQPFFTPDGGAILYTSIREDGQADTYRYDIASRETRRVTTTAESEYSPTPIPGQDRFAVIQVEADSTQRLWSFGMDGSGPRLVLEDIEPVGYQAWAGPGTVAIFVLGEPATLQLAQTDAGTARVVADGIGRSIQKVPGRNAITFTQSTDDGWWIRELDPATGEVGPVAPMLGADEYHVWSPDGALLAASGTRLLRWAGDADEATGEWVEIADLAALGTLTRLAMAPGGDRLAVVVNR